MSEEEIKEIIDIVASIQVSNETEAIAKEELMSYAEQLQKEYNILTLLCDIIKLQHQLEEKDKVIDEAINYINKHRAGFVQPMKYIELSEILTLYLQISLYKYSI